MQCLGFFCAYKLKPVTITDGNLQSTSGIIRGSGLFAVQFGDHFRFGDHMRFGIRRLYNIFETWLLSAHPWSSRQKNMAGS